MSVTAPKGFRAAGAAAGLKSSGALDIALVVADAPAPASAVFTTNAAAAAPVIVSRRHLRETGGLLSAIVANSGCANAGTGAAGEHDATAMAAAVSGLTGRPPAEVLVASTGPIGPRLPLNRVVAGIEEAHSALERTEASSTAAAQGIMTTDTVAKEVVVRRDGFSLGGMAKGSGMIRPDMATMLCFVTTDAVATPEELRAALISAVDASFHSLNIDGCSSTNDTVVVMASGSSGVEPGLPGLEAALTEGCVDLAQKMAEDAEGARRVVSIRVVGATDDGAARASGRAIADSALVRSSFFGGDPNWGRLLGALGASGIPFDPELFGVAYQGVDVAAAGAAVDHDETFVLDLLADGDLDVTVTVGDGPGRATVLTTDLTPEYVVFNGEPS